ncbi:MULTISPECIES: phage holin family protein [Yersinia]|uniref:Phage holin family protein n=1 Tax=Yersinia proxima TaxID=2890316 RepID=A0ABW9F427_9GAMM|nr:MULTISPECIES: phage holin family protein [Yersinia]ELI7922731.1 phage holin family protein [Yersinia enterocolitica]
MTIPPVADSQIVTWLIIGGLSAWGGLVRYLLDMKGKQGVWCWVGLLSQIIISSFTGLLGGLLSFENGVSAYMTFIVAGLFGTLGGTALSYLWQRFFPVKGNKS